MELYDVMRSTFAVREFTADPLPDEVLYRILDNARFAPSGGNRQGAHIIVVRDATMRQQLAELAVPGARRYLAQIQAGESVEPVAAVHRCANSRREHRSARHVYRAVPARGGGAGRFSGLERCGGDGPRS